MPVRLAGHECDGVPPQANGWQTSSVWHNSLSEGVLMHARWLCLTSFSILIACGGESTSHAGKGGSGAQAGSGGDATGGGSGNGGSGAVAGGSGGVGGSVGGGGSPCQAIMDSYAAVMKSMKVCDPFIDLNECTGTVPNSIICSCAPTYINPANTEAIENLEHIQEEAFAQGCLPFGCPAIACEQPALGTCEPDPSGNSGTCQDLYTNDDPGGGN
jgi:hypothetical protein